MSETKRRNELLEMAERIAEVLNDAQKRLPLTPEDVDLRLVAELCWAIGVQPEFHARPLPTESTHD